MRAQLFSRCRPQQPAAASDPGSLAGSAMTTEFAARRCQRQRDNPQTPLLELASEDRGRRQPSSGVALVATGSSCNAGQSCSRAQQAYAWRQRRGTFQTDWDSGSIWFEACFDVLAELCIWSDHSGLIKEIMLLLSSIFAWLFAAGARQILASKEEQCRHAGLTAVRATVPCSLGTVGVCMLAESKEWFLSASFCLSFCC